MTAGDLDDDWTTDLPLWPHQVAALQVVRNYVEEATASTGPIPAALVRMPTGSGKSGVIALAARKVAAVGDVLLVSPWDNLVDQLRADVSGRFWERLKRDPPPDLVVKRIYPSTAAAHLAAHNSGGCIWLCTNATLQALQAQSPACYTALASRLALVVVDEGHYEPAASWSLAVRGLNCQTVLFTATPYRNDLKYFQVDLNHYFQLSHRQAEEAHFLREVRFEAIEFADHSQFVNELIKAAHSLPQSSRVIVRCSNRNDVLVLTQLLNLAGESAIGIHDTFSGDDSSLRTHPPTPSDESARYWVHQNKLTEGIDDPRFRMVAFFETFTSHRSIVQQIGRILRNPERNTTARAVVLHQTSVDLPGVWQSYKKYDAETEIHGLPPSPREFVIPLTGSQYIDGRFREPFDVHADGAFRQLRYILSSRIFDIGTDFAVSDITELVTQALDDADFEHAVPAEPLPGLRIHPYIAIRNSSLLLDSTYFDQEVGYTVYWLTQCRLYYHDTQGVIPEAIRRFRQPEVASLNRLLPNSSTRLTSVTLRNTDLNRSAARSRRYTAFSIAELAGDVSDHAHLASTARGYTDVQHLGPVDRYVGLSRSRVSDRGRADFEDFYAWLQTIESSLTDTSARGVDVLSRYATQVDTPVETAAAHILLELDQSQFADSLGIPPHLDDLAIPVSNETLTISVDGTSHPATLRWVDSEHRYLLSCSTLDETYGMVAAAPYPRRMSLIQAINSEQLFRVLTKGSASNYCVYTEGRFFRPNLPLGPGAYRGIDLLQVIKGVPVLANIGSEKGPPSSATSAGWHADSLFGLVDQRDTGPSAEIGALMSGAELLICDDMGTEVADFILVRTDATGGRTVAFIHAKATPSPHELSASIFHEVTAQAVKNLAFLQPFNTQRPQKVEKWGGAWTSSPVGKVDHRIRVGSASTGIQAWNLVQAALQDPSTMREVWVLVGNGLSLSRLETERVKTKPRPEVIQILYSLQATWTSVSAIGARLRVLCSP